MNYTAYIDGSCNPNPSGLMGVGIVVYNDQKEKIFEASETFEAEKGNSNNLAEYMALDILLDFLRELKGKVTVYSDSSLVVNQVNGAYKIKGGFYSTKAFKVLKKIQNLRGVFLSVKWIPREENKIADYLSKKDSIEKPFDWETFQLDLERYLLTRETASAYDISKWCEKYLNEKGGLK